MQFIMNPNPEITANIIPIAIAGEVNGLANATLRNRIGHARLPGQCAYRSDHANLPIKVTIDRTIAMRISIKKNSYKALECAQVLYLLYPSIVKYSIPPHIPRLANKGRK